MKRLLLIGYVLICGAVLSRAAISDDLELRAQQIEGSHNNGGYEDVTYSIIVPKGTVAHVSVFGTMSSGNCSKSSAYLIFTDDGGKRYFDGSANGTTYTATFTETSSVTLYATATPGQYTRNDSYFDSVLGRIIPKYTYVTYSAYYCQLRYALTVKYEKVNVSTYKIEFKANGGSGTMTSLLCAPGKVYALTRCAFRKSDRSFKGWACSNGKRYDDGVLVFNLAQPGETVMMTAIWDGEGGQQKEYGGVQLWEGGPYWAECNVGASKPEEYGYYFWWGDVVGYRRNVNGNGWISVKDSTSFLFSRGNCPTYGRNNSQLQSAGYIDSSGNLVAAHDAATAHLGAPWRMPTDAELDTLTSNCDAEWITRNGVYGRLIKGRGAYASRSIFLPAAGIGYDSGLDYLGLLGDYWSSTPNSDSSNYAWYLYFYGGSLYRYYRGRNYGQSVRPVRGFAR